MGTVAGSTRGGGVEGDGLSQTETVPETRIVTPFVTPFVTEFGFPATLAVAGWRASLRKRGGVGRWG